MPGLWNILENKEKMIDRKKILPLEQNPRTDNSEKSLQAIINWSYQYASVDLIAK